MYNLLRKPRISLFWAINKGVTNIFGKFPALFFRPYTQLARADTKKSRDFIHNLGHDPSKLYWCTELLDIGLYLTRGFAKGCCCRRLCVCFFLARKHFLAHVFVAHDG